jgi:hypothetical protein
MAADSYAQSYNDTFESIDDLNDAIEDAGCILDVIYDWPSLWPEADTRKIGTDNFYGKDWERKE